MPNVVVLQPYGVPGDQTRWGFVAYKPEEPGGKVRLDLRGRLAIDPGAFDALRRVFIRRGEPSSGEPFLRMRPGELASAPPGVLSARASLNNDEITLSLSMDALEANKILWLLTQPAGIGLTFRCSYKDSDDERSRFDLALGLSAARREPTDLSVADGKLTNTGRYPVLARFLRGGDGSLWPPVADGEAWLKPGAQLDIRKTYRVPTGSDLAGVSVPGEATELSNVDWQAGLHGRPRDLRDGDADQPPPIAGGRPDREGRGVGDAGRGRGEWQSGDEDRARHPLAEWYPGGGAQPEFPTDHAGFAAVSGRGNGLLRGHGRPRRPEAPGVQRHPPRYRPPEIEQTTPFLPGGNRIQRRELSRIWTDRRLRNYALESFLSWILFLKNWRGHSPYARLSLLLRISRS